MNNTRGSAILIAIFLVAAVGSVSFGIGRLFMLDSSIANMYENSTIAYYAAESGVEEGLLRYRYDSDQEVGINSSSMRIYNIDDDTAVPGNAVTYMYSPTKRYFTVSDTYLSRWYGDGSLGSNQNILDQWDLASSDYPDDYTVPRDESVKLNISRIDTADDLDLWVKFQNDSGDSCDYSTAKPFIELKLTGNTPAAQEYQTKIALVKSGSIPDSFNQTSYIIGGYYSSADVLKFDKIIQNTRSRNSDAIFDIGQLELTLKPIGCEAKIGIKTNPDNNATAKKLPSPYNTITATGYYGGITRTITAKIDRQAGTVYDLFDYVVYNTN